MLLLNLLIKNISAIFIFFLFLSLCKMFDLFHSNSWLQSNLWFVTTEKLPEGLFYIISMLFNTCLQMSLGLSNINFITVLTIYFIDSLRWLEVIQSVFTFSNNVIQLFRNGKSNVDNIFHYSFYVITNLAYIRDY